MDLDESVRDRPRQVRLEAVAGDHRLLDNPLARVRLGGRQTRDKPVPCKR